MGTRTRKLARTPAALRSWSRQPDSEYSARPMLWALLVGTIAFLSFAYSGAPKGPLAGLLPGPSGSPVIGPPSVAEFVAERTALTQRLRERRALPAVSTRGSAS